jgi:hypothetical protein
MTVGKAIAVGDEFEVALRGVGDRFRREPDDEEARPSERIQVTHLASGMDMKMRPYTFGTEPEWFRQRGLTALGAKELE